MATPREWGEPRREHPGQRHRAIERRPGVSVEQASRRPIDRPAGEVALGGIGEIDVDIGVRAGNFNEIHGGGSGFASR